MTAIVSPMSTITFHRIITTTGKKPECRQCGVTITPADEYYVRKTNKHSKTGRYHIHCAVLLKIIQ